MAQWATSRQHSAPVDRVAGATGAVSAAEYPLVRAPPPSTPSRCQCSRFGNGTAIPSLGTEVVGRDRRHRTCSPAHNTLRGDCPPRREGRRAPTDRATASPGPDQRAPCSPQRAPRVGSRVIPVSTPVPSGGRGEPPLWRAASRTNTTIQHHVEECCEGAAGAAVCNTCSAGSIVPRAVGMGGLGVAFWMDQRSE